MFRRADPSGLKFTSTHFRFSTLPPCVFAKSCQNRPNNFPPKNFLFLSCLVTFDDFVTLVLFFMSDYILRWSAPFNIFLRKKSPKAFVFAC
jgi:hypothetical protein